MTTVVTRRLRSLRIGRRVNEHNGDFCQSAAHPASLEYLYTHHSDTFRSQGPWLFDSSPYPRPVIASMIQRRDRARRAYLLANGAPHGLFDRYSGGSRETLKRRKRLALTNLLVST